MKRNPLLPIAVALGALAVASCAPEQPAPPLIAATAQPVPAVPAQLRPPAWAVPLLRANARGVQVYACGAKPGGFAWSFKAPDAVLFDPAGEIVARHFAGPTWQAMDSSMVVGEVAASLPAPNGHGVPWLLLRAKVHEGHGAFADVGFIQRLDTNGGAAPALPCDAAHGGQEARIPYTATYVLYR